MITTLRCLLLGILFGLGSSTAWAADVPSLQNRVTDLTGTLSYQQSMTLERELASFEASKGSQIAVLIVPTTRPETIEQYGMRVAEAWQVGRRGVDDGAILIVAKDDHRMRIEVGYGLEGALTDVTAKRIVSEIIAPAFKQNQYFDGISAGTNRMMAVINGEQLPPPTRGVSLLSDRQWTTLGAVFFVFLLLGYLVRWMFSAAPAALSVGAVVGAVGMHMTGDGGVGMIAGVVAAVAAYVIYSGGWNSGPYYDDDWRWGRRRWYNDWGGGGSSWGGGSGGSSGGFSGGGGGFGGGGASGDW
jgi:uncharacterized protein